MSQFGDLAQNFGDQGENLDFGLQLDKTSDQFGEGFHQKP
jgi:hypothetical protein